MRDLSASSIAYAVAQVICVGRTEPDLRRRAEVLGRELHVNGLAGRPAEVVDKLGEFTAIGASRA